jgi:hypothetical protein
MDYKLTDTCPDETTRILCRIRTNTCDGCVAKDDVTLCKSLGAKCAKPKFHMWHVWQVPKED